MIVKSDHKECDRSGETPAFSAAIDGATVTLEYTGTICDGRIFDKATPENPFCFTLGADQAMPAFEAEIRGMRLGESRSFSIPPQEAYGVRHEELVITVSRESFPPDERIEVGKRARVADADGNDCVMKVVEVTESAIKLDGNHPLAGELLTYNNVTLTAIS
jgi:FKBP-type peptidyl-prolyl cis-trans isomerase 2